MYRDILITIVRATAFFDCGIGIKFTLTLLCSVFKCISLKLYQEETLQCSTSSIDSKYKKINTNSTQSKIHN